MVVTFEQKILINLRKNSIKTLQEMITAHLVRNVFLTFLYLLNV